jgi:hypothetical protein
MEKGRRKLLEKMPTRKLLASIKKDIRRVIQASAASGKSKKR